MIENQPAVGAPVEPSVRPLVECLADLEAAADNGCQCADNTNCIEPCAARIATATLADVGPAIRDALRRALLRSVRVVA